MTITLSLNILFPICNWTIHSSTRMSIPLPAPETVMLCFFCSFCIIYFNFVNIALSEFTSSMVTSLMTFSSQLDSEPVALSCKSQMSCSACSMKYVDSWGLLERAAFLTEMLLFLAFFRSLSLYFFAISALLRLYLS